jgi:hypothetical protein
VNTSAPSVTVMTSMRRVSLAAGFKLRFSSTHIHSDVIQLTHAFPERLCHGPTPLRWYPSV